jgi:uncharacterized protein YdeI (YjbR/CyaY-like superfamily)
VKRAKQSSVTPVGDRAPRVEALTRSQWRAWLARNADTSGPIWLVYPKLGKRARSKQPTRPVKPETPARGSDALTYDAIVEEALCVGWVDSLPRALDFKRAMLYLSPRRPGSVWSALNKRRVESLRERGLMRASGEARITAAMADGSWATLDQAEALIMPPDLALAFDADPQARSNYESFPRGAKKQLLTWITTAKRESTRAERIARSVAMAHDNVRASAASGRAKPSTEPTKLTKS